jgi:hypothetical protein
MRSQPRSLAGRHNLAMLWMLWMSWCDCGLHTIGSYVNVTLQNSLYSLV